MSATDVNSARQYFRYVLLEAYESLGRTLIDGITGDKRDLKAVGDAAQACLHMADHIARDPQCNSNIPGAPRSRQYFDSLVSGNSNFAIVRDMANAIKHHGLSADYRTFDGIDALAECWALVRYTDARGHYWATRKSVRLILSSGTQVLAEDIVERCVLAWAEELVRIGVLTSKPTIDRLPRYVSRRDAQLRMHMVGEVGDPVHLPALMLSYDEQYRVFLPLQGPIGKVAVNFTADVKESRL